MTIKTNAGRGALTELAERQNQYPGVIQEQISVRDYPYEDIAAQVFGYVSRITKEEEEPKPQRPFKGVKPGDRRPAGPRVLVRPLPAGHAGAQQIEVNSEGQPAADETARIEPSAGYTLG